MFLAVMLMGTTMWGQYNVDFESNAGQSNYTTASIAINGINWSFSEALIGNLSGDWKNGSNSLRIRGRNGSVASMIQDKSNGLGTISFQYRRYSTDTGHAPYAVEYSTDGGTNWIQIGSNITATATVQTFTENVNVAGNVRIRFRVTTSPGTSGDRRWNIDDITMSNYNSSPTINTSATSLTGFTYVAGSGPSAQQSFTVGGTNLTGNINIPATTNYEISTTSGSGFSSSAISLTPTTGTVSNTTIYVRLKAGLAAGNYNSEVSTITSTGATDKTMTLSGSVTAPVLSAALSGGPLGEAALTAGTATATVTLTNETYKADLTAAGFVLNNAPTGLTVASVVRTSATVATLHFAFTGDIDTNVTNLSVTVAASELSTSASGLTTGVMTLTAVNETLNTTPTSITGLNYINGAGPSTAQSFTVGSGNNLRAGGGTITLTAPSNFEVSTTSATTGFGTSADLTYTGTGTFASNTAWVRLKAGLTIAAYSQSVTIAGGKASTSITVAGSVIAPPPANDECTGAIALTVNAAAVQGTVQNATQSLAPIVCNSFTGTSDEDVWYSFTTSSAGSYTITADGGNDLDLIVDLRSGACNGTNISCADTENGIETITASLSASTTYYIRLYDYAALSELTSYNFTIRVAKDIAAPIATAATNVSTTGFTANWENSADAASYQLDVYTTTTQADSTTEGFAGGTTAPTDWTFTGISTTYPNSGSYGAASPSISLDNTNDRVETATYSGSATSLSFWIKGQSTNTTSALLVEGFNGTSWVTIQNIAPLPTSGTTKLYNAASTPALPSNIVKFRFTYSKSQGNLAFDDVVVNYQAAIPTYVTNYNSKSVTGTSDVLTGLTPGTTYHYRLRGVNGVIVTSNSNVINVTTGLVNTWNGSAWSAGTAPTIIDNAVIAGDYSTAINGTFTANLLHVDTNTLTVAANTVLTVNRGITVDADAAMTVMSNGNVIQNNETATNSGTVTVYRESNALKRFDYKIWSSPVSGQVMSAFSPDTDASRFYQYVTDSNNYQAIANSSSFGFGRGYLIRMPWNHPTAPAVWNGKYEGGLNTGEHTVALDLNNDNAANSYNAVGNPYASPINANKFIDGNSGSIEGTLWFWRKTNGSAADTYATYNRTMGGNSTSPGVPAPNGYIQVGQGFIVNATATSLSFTNAMRESNFANQFFRNGNQNADTTPERHRIWVNLTNADGAFSQALVGYAAGATNGLDAGIDSKYLATNNASFFSVIAGGQYALQGRALPFSTTDVVPMGYKAVTAGSYSLSLDHVDGLFTTTGQPVFIKDNVTNTVHNLLEGSYTFTSGTGTFLERFEIIFAHEALGIDSPVLNPESVAVYKDGNMIKVNSGTAELSEVTVFDMRGRMLATQKASGTEATVSNITSVQQVLVVQVKTALHGIVSKKIVY